MRKDEALDEITVRERLAALPGWTGDGTEIRARFEFDDFRGAMRFMDACVDGIEQRDHHPTWTNRYHTVEVRLTSFDAGHRVTARDFELARFIEAVLRAQGADFGYRRR
ncbi:MAG: 4a-hydroxytetrahydrobiopterin dehydratase [Rubrivivax sp.]